MNQDKQTTEILNSDELHSAYIIDEQGNEIPITREMIEAACQASIALHADSTGKSQASQYVLQ